LLRLVERLRDVAFPRPRERDLVDPERRAFADVLRDLDEDLFLADEVFVFLRGRDFAFFTLAFFAGFAAALTFRAALFTVFLAADVALLSCEAARPARAPRTPPTTAPTGPAILPMTAPVAAPAVCLEMGGISMFSEEPGEGSPPFCCCSSSFGINTELLIAFLHYVSRKSTLKCASSLRDATKKSA
jgi:hypothetical protein